MLQVPKQSRLDIIKNEIPALSQAEMLELIAYLAQYAQKTTVLKETAPEYKWQDIAGIAPDLLEGTDAQEWVSKIRSEEWDRDVHE
jgi:hypothetical protein